VRVSIYIIEQKKSIAKNKVVYAVGKISIAKDCGRVSQSVQDKPRRENRMCGEAVGEVLVGLSKKEGTCRNENNLLKKAF